MSCIVTLDGFDGSPLKPLIDREKPFNKLSDAMMHYALKAERKMQGTGITPTTIEYVHNELWQFGLYYVTGGKCGEGIVEVKEIPCQTSECMR